MMTRIRQVVLGDVVLFLVVSGLLLHDSAEGQGAGFGSKVVWPPAPLITGTGHCVITAAAPMQEFEVKIERLVLIPWLDRSIVVTDPIAKGHGTNAAPRERGRGGELAATRLDAARSTSPRARRPVRRSASRRSRSRARPGSATSSPRPAAVERVEDAGPWARSSRTATELRQDSAIRRSSAGSSRRHARNSPASSLRVEVCAVHVCRRSSSVRSVGTTLPSIETECHLFTMLRPKSLANESWSSQSAEAELDSGVCRPVDSFSPHSQACCCSRRSSSGRVGRRERAR